jgi:phosphoribosylformylglycinamidine synthase
VDVTVVSDASAWTRACAPGQVLRLPVKHGEGRYYHPEPAALDGAGQVVLRYVPGHNPNGALADIAGVSDAAGNVVGLMPHPEHAVDPLLGPAGGRPLLESVLAAAGVGVR